MRVSHPVAHPISASSRGIWNIRGERTRFLNLSARVRSRALAASLKYSLISQRPVLRLPWTTPAVLFKFLFYVCTYVRGEMHRPVSAARSRYTRDSHAAAAGRGRNNGSKGNVARDKYKRLHAWPCATSPGDKYG